MKKVFLSVVAAMVVLSWGMAAFAMLPPPPINKNHCAVGHAHNKIVPKKLKNIDVFWGLVAEYQKRIRHANSPAFSCRTRQAEAFRAYLAFEELTKAYGEFSEEEKRQIFADSRAKNLPSGVNIDGTGELKKIGAIPLTTGDRRKDFEDFLRDSYTEIDYMSSWSIFGQFKIIEARYRAYLASKGLLIF